MSSRALPFAALIAAATATSCRDEQENTFSEHDMLQSITENVILATYEQLEQDTSELLESAAALCEQGTTGTDGGLSDAGASSLAAFDRAAAAWRAARATWKRGDAFAFGPYTDEPYRVGPDVDFFPVRQDVVDELLTSDDSLADGFLAERGAVYKGLPVAEYLLFGEEGWRDSAAAQAALVGPAGERRCAYLVAVSEALHDSAERLIDGWTDESAGFAAQFVGDTASEDLASTHDSVELLLNTMVGALFEMREDGLEKPAGLYGNDPVPDSLLSPYSDHAALDAAATLRGVHQIFWGALKDDDEALGLQDYLEAQNAAELAASLDAKMNTAEDQLRGLHPLREAIVDFLPEVQQAYERVSEIEESLAEEAAEILRVPIGFGAGDGD